MTTFAVLAHDDPQLLARLCRRLAPFPVVVQLDARRDRAPFVQALAEISNARLSPSRVRANWGGWSLVEATLALYREVLPGLPDDEQVVLLSGHCYPLRPVEQIVAELDAAPRRLYLRGAPYPSFSDHARTRFRHFYDVFPVRQTGYRRILAGVPRKIAQRVSRLFPRTIPGEDQFVLGSQWSVLTAGAIRDAVLPAAQRYRRLLRHTEAPDEMFFATAILRSPFASQTQDGGVGAFLGEKTADYANIHLLDRSMMKTYTLEDREEVASSSMLFVRKVDSSRSAGLLDELDRRAESG